MEHRWVSKKGTPKLSRREPVTADRMLIVVIGYGLFTERCQLNWWGFLTVPPCGQLTMVRKTTYRRRYPRWLARLVTGLTSTLVIFVIPFNELTLWVSLGRCFISPRDFFDASWRHPSIISHDLLKLETLPPMPDCLHGIRASTYTQHFSWQFR